jgi:hypothetical protein
MPHTPILHEKNITILLYDMYNEYSRLYMKKNKKFAAKYRNRRSSLYSVDIGGLLLLHRAGRTSDFIDLPQFLPP